MNWTLVSMPSVGLGGIARGGVRMDKRGFASRLYGGGYGVNLHFRLPRTGTVQSILMTIPSDRKRELKI